MARETEARSPRGVWLNRAEDLVGGIARALHGEVAGDVVGGAIGTAGAIATAPFRDSYNYDRDRGYDYDRYNGYACHPGTWFTGADGRRHPCQ